MKLNLILTLPHLCYFWTEYRSASTQVSTPEAPKVDKGKELDVIVHTVGSVMPSHSFILKVKCCTVSQLVDICVFSRKVPDAAGEPVAVCRTSAVTPRKPLALPW